MTKENHAEQLYSSEQVANATGALPVPMTNDYLFRALLQKNNNVLKGLISSLLHLPVEHIASVEITNPIELGKTIKDKDFILDIKVLMNNHSIINLEMQVINERNWTDRSLSYLCRSFDQLNSGDDYTLVKPVSQISFLDFTLFPEHPEFYATYQFLNIKNCTLYSDKLALSVIDLTHIELATQEDRQYQIDHWATLFKAKTWEEIKMLAQKNEYIKDAFDTIYQLSYEDAIREQCEAREDFYRRQRTREKYLQDAQNFANEVQQENSILKDIIAEKDAEIARLNALLAKKQD